MNTQTLQKQAPLTCRQYEVLMLMGQGYTNPEIAEILSITRHTVKAHVCAIYEAFGTASRVQAIVKAVKSGVVDINDL